MRSWHVSKGRQSSILDFNASSPKLFFDLFHFATHCHLTTNIALLCSAHTLLMLRDSHSDTKLVSETVFFIDSVFYLHMLKAETHVFVLLTNQFTGAWTHYTDTVQGIRTDNIICSQLGVCVSSLHIRVHNGHWKMSLEYLYVLFKCILIGND